MIFVTHTGKKRNSDRFFLARKTEGKRTLSGDRRRWEVNIKIVLEEIVWEVVEWVYLAQDRDKWSALGTG
jgi:hypothetical protein